MGVGETRALVDDETFETAIPEICEVVNGPVSDEVAAVEYEAILNEGGGT